jgi:hypothetical protein
VSTGQPGTSSPSLQWHSGRHWSRWSCLPPVGPLLRFPTELAEIGTARLLHLLLLPPLLLLLLGQLLKHFLRPNQQLQGLPSLLLAPRGDKPQQY